MFGGPTRLYQKEAIRQLSEELNQFITSVNSFHPALKYTWEISETSSVAFLDTKVSINGNGLCTSVHYKPTDSDSYLLHSSSHPSHVKNSIPYSQFLSLRRLCSRMTLICQFFQKRGYPVFVVKAGHHLVFIADQIYRLTKDHNFASQFCGLRFITSGTFAIASIHHLTLISIERYFAIKYPFQYHDVITKSRFVVAVLVAGPFRFFLLFSQ